MNKKLRRLLHKILTSALVYIAALALPLPPAGKMPCLSSHILLSALIF